MSDNNKFPTTDLDLVAYSIEVLGRKIEMNDKPNANGKYGFMLTMTDKEVDEYYESVYKKIKLRIDTLKRKISNKKKNNF